MRRTFQDLARKADIEAIVREIQAAVGAVISLAKYRDLLQDGASWWKSGGEAPETENGHPAIAR
jgi:hypothetical protein